MNNKFIRDIFQLLASLFLITVCGATLLAGCQKSETDEVKFYREISNVDKLYLSSMAINKVGEYNDDSNWKIGKRIAVYSYKTYVRGYIDMTQLTPDDVKLDKEKKTAVVTLPPVQTEISGRDFTMKEEHYRVSGLRSRIGARERAQLKEEMNKTLKKEVAANPQFKKMIEESAERKARVLIKQLMAEGGYAAEVNFKN